MKTLLRGGPLDGKVVDLSSNTFGYSEVEEVYKQLSESEKLISHKEIYYGSSYEYERHPCKKKGTIRVFRYDPISHGLRTAIHQSIKKNHSFGKDLSKHIDKWLDRPKKSLGGTPRKAILEGNGQAVWDILNKKCTPRNVISEWNVLNKNHGRRENSRMGQ